MKLSKKITGGIVGLAMLGGLSVNDDVRKTVKCVGKEIQLEQGDNYYCASYSNYKKDKDSFKQRIKDNKLQQFNDPAFAQMSLKEDPIFMEQIRSSMVGKYKEGEFDFGEDFQAESQLAVITADIICSGDCLLEGKTISDKIFNILNQ